MRGFFPIAYLAVLICLTLLAIRMWWTRRGATIDPAEQRVFVRFVLGIALFWGVALVGYLAGFFTLPG